MDNKEMEKLNTEELDNVAGGGYLDDAIDTVTNTVKKGAAFVNKGIETVKTTKDAALQAGETILNDVVDVVNNGVAIAGKSIEAVKASEGALGEAGKAILNNTASNIVKGF